MNPFLKSVVREICMLRSVGAGGGRPPLATRSRGCDSSGLLTHETIRFWWNRFGPLFAAEIRKKRTDRMRAFSARRRHLDEVFVKINGERHYLWRAVDQEGEVREAFVSKNRDRKAALKFPRKLMRRYGRPDTIVTDRLISYRTAVHEMGGSGLQQAGRWLNNRAENFHLPFRRREDAMLRFGRMRGFQKFTTVHSVAYNHFNLRRSRRQTQPPRRPLRSSTQMS